MFAYAKRQQKPKQVSKDIIQKKEPVNIPAYLNQTGIPNDMKTRFEYHSGFLFDDVRVHYNSDKPAQLQALAYTQGNHVYVGPGQEKHLGHELGHVVQQKQGVVEPVSYIGNVPINTDSVLEKSADKISEDTNKEHKTTMQLKKRAEKRQLVSSTIQLIGGRDEDWGKLGARKINTTYQILANELAVHYNTCLDNIINECNGYNFRKKNPILRDKHILRISGSTLVMKINPDKFVADDIDLDYYNYETANKIDSINDDTNSIVWNRLVSAFVHKPFEFEDNDFSAIKTECGDRSLGREELVFKITFKGNPTQYFINVELKNITSKIWHKGWKTEETRDMGSTMEISEKQLYMDTCLRINDIIDAVLSQQPEINRDTPKYKLVPFQRQIEESVEAKQYMVKKSVLEEYLILHGKYKEAIDMAEEKLDKKTYKKWYLISRNTNLNLNMVHKYLRY